jgi:hypothetical protein
MSTLPSKKHKNITEKNNAGFIVRIVRDGVEHSEYFSNNLWNSRAEALAAAKNWRDCVAQCVGKRKAINSCSKNEVSGVSRTIKHDSRRDTSNVVYQVFWLKDGKDMRKSFYVGDIDKISNDDDLHGFNTAKHFRSCYELSVKDGAAFDDGKFAGWKKVKLY